MIFLVSVGHELNAWGDDNDLPEADLIEAIQLCSADQPIRCMQSRIFRALLEQNAAELQRLIRLGADVATMIYLGNETVLHVAARVGYGPILECLLRAVPSWLVNRPNHQGETPLHYAAARGHYTVAALLLGAGAQNRIDAQGRTARDLAEDAGYAGIVDVIDLFQRQGVFHGAEHLDTERPESCFEAFLDAYFGGC